VGNGLRALAQQRLVGTIDKPVHTCSRILVALGNRAVGDYNGRTISGYAEVGKIFETQDGFRMQPIAALSYSHLDTDSYNERGAGVLLHVFDSSYDSLKSMVGGRFAYPFTDDWGHKLVPEARISRRPCRRRVSSSASTDSRRLRVCSRVVPACLAWLA